MTYQALILKRDALERHYGQLISRKIISEMTPRERLIVNLWVGIIRKLARFIDVIPSEEEMGRGKNGGRYHAEQNIMDKLFKKRAAKILLGNPDIMGKDLAVLLYITPKKAGGLLREWRG